MRGFLVGSLLLIGVYVAVQPRGAAAVQQGGGWFISGLRRALSPDVAGVPQLGGPHGRAAGGGRSTSRIPASERG